MAEITITVPDALESVVRRILSHKAAAHAESLERFWGSNGSRGEAEWAAALRSVAHQLRGQDPATGGVQP